MVIAKEEETEGYLGQENLWRPHSEGAAGSSRVWLGMKQEKNGRIVRSGKIHACTDIDCWRTSPLEKSSGNRLPWKHGRRV
jgi:hypothetical protein